MDSSEESLRERALLARSASKGTTARPLLALRANKARSPLFRRLAHERDPGGGDLDHIAGDQRLAAADRFAVDSNAVLGLDEHQHVLAAGLVPVDRAVVPRAVLVGD